LWWWWWVIALYSHFILVLLLLLYCYCLLLIGVIVWYWTMKPFHCCYYLLLLCYSIEYSVVFDIDVVIILRSWLTVLFIIDTLFITDLHLLCFMRPLFLFPTLMVIVLIIEPLCLLCWWHWPLLLYFWCYTLIEQWRLLFIIVGCYWPVDIVVSVTILLLVKVIVIGRLLLYYWLMIVIIEQIIVIDHWPLFVIGNLLSCGMIGIVIVIIVIDDYYCYLLCYCWYRYCVIIVVIGIIEISIVIVTITHWWILLLWYSIPI